MRCILRGETGAFCAHFARRGGILLRFCAVSVGVSVDFRRFRWFFQKNPCATCVTFSSPGLFFHSGSRRVFFRRIFSFPRSFSSRIFILSRLFRRAFSFRRYFASILLRFALFCFVLLRAENRPILLRFCFATYGRGKGRTRCLPAVPGGFTKYS